MQTGSFASIPPALPVGYVIALADDIQHFVFSVKTKKINKNATDSSNYYGIIKFIYSSNYSFS